MLLMIDWKWLNGVGLISKWDRRYTFINTPGAAIIEIDSFYDMIEKIDG
jgi:hypothetical protein